MITTSHLGKFLVVCLTFLFVSGSQKDKAQNTEGVVTKTVVMPTAILCTKDSAIAANTRFIDSSTFALSKKIETIRAKKKK